VNEESFVLGRDDLDDVVEERQDRILQKVTKGQLDWGIIRRLVGEDEWDLRKLSFYQNRILREVLKNCSSGSEFLTMFMNALKNAKKLETSHQQVQNKQRSVLRKEKKLESIGKKVKEVKEGVETGTTFLVSTTMSDIELTETITTALPDINRDLLSSSIQQKKYKIASKPPFTTNVTASIHR
jgi:hypothetical protein